MLRTHSAQILLGYDRDFSFSPLIFTMLILRWHVAKYLIINILTLFAVVGNEESVGGRGEGELKGLNIITCEAWPIIKESNMQTIIFRQAYKGYSK